MPLSESWTVRNSRPGSAAASASITITTSGCAVCMAHFTSSRLSIPVCANTPGWQAATRMSPGSASPCPACRWCVTIRFFTASGPIASGVMSRLPSPTTSACLHGPSSSRSARPTVRAALEKLPGSRRVSASSSAVIYVPRGLPSACSPSALVIFTTVMRTPCRSCSRAMTPESFVCSCAERSYNALASIARSVLGCIDSPLG